MVISHQQKVEHHRYEHQEAQLMTQDDAKEIIMEEKKLHEETESYNRTQKQNKKEEYERTDQANISEIESETKQHQVNLEALETTLES